MGTLLATILTFPLDLIELVGGFILRIISDIDSGITSFLVGLLGG